MAAEDTRHTRRLLAHFGIAAQVVSLHEHNERARAASLVERVQAGENVALVTDAGSLGIADPRPRRAGGNTAVVVGKLMQGGDAAQVDAALDEIG